MPLDDTTMTAAPAAVRVGERDLIMSPLTIGDWCEFTRWAQERLCKNAGVAVTDLDALEELIRRYTAMSWYDAEIRSLRNGFDGRMLIYWLGLRHNHPRLTLPELVGMLTLEQEPALMTVYARLNFRGERGDDEGPRGAQKKSPEPGLPDAGAAVRVDAPAGQ